MVVIVDAEANSIARNVLETSPALSLAVDLRAVALESGFPQSSEMLLARLAADGLAATVIYLALEEKSLSDAWERELCTADRVRGGPSALVLPVRFPRGRMAERTLLAEEESLDALPRQLHAAYLERLQKQGLEGSSAAAVRWQSLPFDYQEDNRSSADHMWTKARDLGLQITERCSEPAVLPSEIDVEPLALAEHRRWIASRALTGWQLGEKRADDERVHPSLVPWANLSEEERVKDRDVVRHIPSTLAAGGFGLRHLVPIALPRGGLADLRLDDVLKAVHTSGDRNNSMRVPLLLVAIENSADFRHAQTLAQRGDVALSLVIAQSLAGLAVAAGQLAQSGSELAESAWTITLTRADCIDRALERASSPECPQMIWTRATILLAAILASPGALAFTRTMLPDTAERQEIYSEGTRVLIIAVSRYRDPSWPTLNSHRDAERIRQMFLQSGVADSAITTVEPDPDHDSDIQAALVRFGETLPADSNNPLHVIVYIAGHGFTSDGLGYLVPPNAPDPARQPVEFSLAALPLPTLLARVSTFRAADVLLILDACFSGLALESLPRERFPHPPSAGSERDRKVLQVITAGTAGQTVADDGLFSELADRRAHGRGRFEFRRMDQRHRAGNVLAAAHDRVIATPPDTAVRQHPGPQREICGGGELVRLSAAHDAIRDKPAAASRAQQFGISRLRRLSVAARGAGAVGGGRVHDLFVSRNGRSGSLLRRIRRLLQSRRVYALALVGER